MERPTVLDRAQHALHEELLKLEGVLDADLLTLLGPIRDGVEGKVRHALEPLTPRRDKLAVVLHTVGGIVEIAERMVGVMRHHYGEIVFIIPDIAMSAGTVLAMSGDAVMMDYFSCLGPIDPQVLREGKLVPAMSYLVQYDRLLERAQQGVLTNAEFMILQSFDQAELHKFEMARDLSISLLVKWLSAYKFKDWVRTETSGRPVTVEDRQARAHDIADALMDHQRWGSHSRGIPMDVLQNDLKLRIDDFGAHQELQTAIRRYHSLAVDYCATFQLDHLAHSREYL